MTSFYETVSAAIRDFAEHGYDSEERLLYWSNKIREAAQSSLVSEATLQRALKANLNKEYVRLVENFGLLKTNKIDRFTLQRVQPKLRAELDRRIMASANLIKLNRQAAIEKTLQRFNGWSTSIPSGGSKAIDAKAVKDTIRKAMTQLPFEERRVIIDQGHKFVASLNEITAMEGNAIAVIWHSHYRQANYNYRKDHKERDRKVYAVRDNWAIEKGLMKKGSAGYYDEITAVGEEVFCRCFGQWVYHLRDLPADMLTRKGAEALQEAKVRVKAILST